MRESASADPAVRAGRRKLSEGTFPFGFPLTAFTDTDAVRVGGVRQLQGNGTGDSGAAARGSAGTATANAYDISYELNPDGKFTYHDVESLMRSESGRTALKDSMNAALSGQGVTVSAVTGYTLVGDVAAKGEALDILAGNRAANAPTGGESNDGDESADDGVAVVSKAAKKSSDEDDGFWGSGYSRGFVLMVAAAFVFICIGSAVVVVVLLAASGNKNKTR